MEKNNTEIVQNTENIIEGAVVETGDKAKTTRKARAKKATANKEVEVTSTFDIDAVLDIKKPTKSALSFNQDKNVADALSALSKSKEVKTSTILNRLLCAIVDVEEGVCKVNIEEAKQEKVQNTYKIDTPVLEVIKKEAKSRNMSTNDYLNKVLEVVLNLK